MQLTYEPLLDLSALNGVPSPRVVSLIPAHNEEDGISKTVLSQFAQTVKPNVVIVMADNCTDGTIELARLAGAQVVETTDNSAKKAGALNQGLALVLPHLSDDDYVLCQDADGELSTTFIQTAIRMYGERPALGGLSAAIVAREANNSIELAQAIEYARGSRLMSRSEGRVHVLSGAATLFPVRVLRQIAASRGTDLPGIQGEIYIEGSLTEDYELTLAIKKLGYECSSSKRLTVVTDVMPTFEALTIQRLRWYRGAMESVQLYGWSKLTRKTWFGIGFTFFASLLMPAAVLAIIAGYFLFGSVPDLRYMLLLPLFVVESVVTSRRVSGQAVAMSVMFVPLWLYDNFMFVLYWRALFQALRHKSRIWVT